MTEEKYKPTAQKTDNLFGDKLYQSRARKALPLLIRQAQAEQPITYQYLAEELDMPNPRNLNYVLGCIGYTLIELSKEWHEKIPAIQSLVINKNTGMPGEGIAEFFMDASEFKRLSSKSKRNILKQELQKVYQYGRWMDVLKKFGLQAVEITQYRISKNKRFFKNNNGGESEEHKRFKEFVSKNPQIIGLSCKVKPGQIEYEFPSGDAVDVLFLNNSQWIGVEVKTIKSNMDDIVRGIYQCIKYRALIEAKQAVELKLQDAKTFLVMEGTFPKKLIGLRNILGVEVFDNIINE